MLLRNEFHYVPEANVAQNFDSDRLKQWLTLTQYKIGTYHGMTNKSMIHC